MVKPDFQNSRRNGRALRQMSSFLKIPSHRLLEKHMEAAFQGLHNYGGSDPVGSCHHDGLDSLQAVSPVLQSSNATLPRQRLAGLGACIVNPDQVGPGPTSSSGPDQAAAYHACAHRTRL